MASSPPFDPIGPTPAARRASLIWIALALVYAFFQFAYLGNGDPEKQYFYLIGGGIACILAAITGYRTLVATRMQR
jgi:hypothetical protein